MSSQLPTDYVRAATVEDAINELATDADVRLLAGGFSLLPVVKDGIEAPDRLVDISHLDPLDGISRESGATHLGALTTHGDIAASPVVREHAPALADATDAVGDYQARRQGTIAGNLVFGDPRYDAPAAFLALDGRVVARGPDGERTIPADEWFRGPGETAIESDEIVTEITVPDADTSGYVRTSEYSGYAIVGAAAALETDDGVVTSARVAVNGAKRYPIRLPGVESALEGLRATGKPGKQAANAALADVDPETLLANDAAAGEYRLRLVRSYCGRAIDRAIDNC